MTFWKKRWNLNRISFFILNVNRKKSSQFDRSIDWLMMMMMCVYHDFKTIKKSHINTHQANEKKWQSIYVKVKCFGDKTFSFFLYDQKANNKKRLFLSENLQWKKNVNNKNQYFPLSWWKKNKFSNSPSKKTNKTDFHNPERIIHHHLKFIRSHTHTLVDGNKYSRYSYVEFYTPINFNGSTVMAKNHHHQHTNIDKQHSIYIVNLNGKKEFFFLHFLYESKKKKKYSRSIMRM